MQKHLLRQRRRDKKKEKKEKILHSPMNAIADSQLTNIEQDTGITFMFPPPVIKPPADCLLRHPDQQ